MKGPKLNERVWKLFEKAGFETTPNSNDPAEHEISLTSKKLRTPDLLAVERELGVRIIGENKSGSEKGSNTKLINDLSALMRADKSKAGLIVSIVKEFSNDDLLYAKSKKIIVWGNDKLKYYESLVDTLGAFSKYELIHSFGIKTKEQKFIHNTLAISFPQPFDGSQVTVFVFTIPPEQLLKTCAIFRKAQGDGDAYQRMVTKKRLKSIRDFVSKENSILPTNILIALSEDVTIDKIRKPTKDRSGDALNLTSDAYELVNIGIPLKYASMEILDGQHRLYGFIQTEPATRKDFNLVVVGILGLSNRTKRDTFIAINDKARRMDPNLVTFLKYTNDEAECQKDNEIMAIKVVFELNRNSHSPFKDRIKMLDLGDQIVTLKGFAGYDLKGLVGKKGLLRKHYSNVSGEYVAVLMDYFNCIKAVFKVQYNDPKKYVVFANKGVSAFLKLLKSIIKHEGAGLSKASLNKYILAIKKNSNDRDWEITELRSKYVGSQGWKQFHRDLVAKIRKEISSFVE